MGTEWTSTDLSVVVEVGGQVLSTFSLLLASRVMPLGFFLPDYCQSLHSSASSIHPLHGGITQVSRPRLLLLFLGLS